MCAFMWHSIVYMCTSSVIMIAIMCMHYHIYGGSTIYMVEPLVTHA